MDSDPPLPPSPAPKKLKFKPKAPPPRDRGLNLPKIEPSDDNDNEAAKALVRKVNEQLSTRGYNVKKKCNFSSPHVELSHGAGSPSTFVRTNANPIEVENDKRNSSDLRDSAEKCTLPASTTTKTDEVLDDGSESSSEEYKEPWDYGTYYPTTLPLRQPYSGDPEFLDEEEFSQDNEHNENSVNSALELGLLEVKEEAQMLFFQFPPNLPLDNQRDQVSASAKGKEKIDSSSMDAKASVKPSLRESPSNRSCSLKEFPGGYMGKMLVYKSGAIKLKLGDNTFNVSSGTPISSVQHAAVMNTEDKDCCIIGELKQRAVVTPDVDSALNNLI